MAGPLRLQVSEPSPSTADQDHLVRLGSTGNVDVIEAILLALESEHRHVVLDHEADAALEALADLYLATEPDIATSTPPTVSALARRATSRR